MQGLPPMLPEHKDDPPHTSNKPQRPDHKRQLNWVVIGGGGLLIGLTMACLVLVAGLVVLYSSSNIAPGVRTAGVEIGGMSKTAAIAEIEASMQSGMLVTDGQQQWRANAAELGIQLDAAATVDAAYEEGRNQFLAALIGGIDVNPVWAIDMATMRNGLQILKPEIDSPAQNAGVQLVNGQVVATPAKAGYQLDIEATLLAIQQDAETMLEDGQLHLVMIPLQPTIIDATPLLNQAAQLLSSQLVVTAFDPINNTKTNWTVAPTTWAAWLEAANSNTGSLSLRLADAPLRQYISGQNNILAHGQYIDVDVAIASIQEAFAQQSTAATVRIYHEPSTHSVISGETFYSVAYDVGIPYSWIREANPGVGDALSVGQTINIPSPDDLLPLPVVENKRIVVSLPQQRMWAYENDVLKWEWIVSTGINDSPTAPGIFQVQSHHENAYAGNWNLWMPYFMGIYQPVPGLDFMNGFHGFPTRDGYQLLWTNSLGTRVTYGCILLSNDNVQLLYNWAEAGVIVEIQG